METLLPKLGFASQTSLHAAHYPPATPPYTPAKHKRRLERSDSPASSVHPTETSSPAKKVLKRTPSDNVLVVELPDGEIVSLADTDIVSPSELEEAEDYLSEIHSDDHATEPTYESDSVSDSDSDSDSGISSRFARLDCEDQEEESEMTQKRLERRLSKRVSIRVFKRPHSQSANGDTGTTDTDDAIERSGDASIRRLRRRMLSPVGGPIDWEYATSSPEPDSFPVLGSPKQVPRQDRNVQRSYASVLKGDEDDLSMEGH
ncbi:hypothetical protein Q7P35_008500 [Cladosporium inversicolor]